VRSPGPGAIQSPLQALETTGDCRTMGKAATAIAEGQQTPACVEDQESEFPKRSERWRRAKAVVGQEDRRYRATPANAKES